MNRSSVERLGSGPGGLVKRLVGAGRRYLSAFAEPLKVKDNVDVNKPVFIWGCGQSGTFLLYDLIAAQEHFVFRYTTGLRKKGFATSRYGGGTVSLPRKPIEGMPHFWAHVGLPFDEDRQEWEFHIPLQQAAETKVDLRRVKQRYRALNSRWPWTSPRPLRILDKDPNYIFIVDLIDKIFPDSLHIFCLRDPRMVVSSICHRFKDPQYESQFFKGYPSGFYSNIFPRGYEGWREKAVEERHAWQVVCVLKEGLRAAKYLGNRCLVTRYESICVDSKKEIQRINRFLGVQTDLELVNRIAGSIAPLSSWKWPVDGTDRESAVRLWIDPRTIDRLTFLNAASVQLGYDRTQCGVVNDRFELSHDGKLPNLDFA